MNEPFELYPAAQILEVGVSPKMVETLKKCYQMELAFPGKPYGPKDFNESFLGLYKRGLLEVDTSNTKLKSASWYITTKGLKFLLSLSAKRLPIKDPGLANNINNLQHSLKQLKSSIYNLKLTSGRIDKQNA